MFVDIPKDVELGVDLMIDLETLGTTPYAPIVSIGAVLFNPYGHDTFQKLWDRSFLVLVDIEDAIKYSGGVEGGTLKWWLSQSDAAIKRLIDGEQIDLKRALTKLYQYALDRGDSQPVWLRKLPSPGRWWAKGPDFDLKIIEFSTKAVGLTYPFHFSKSRDVRTAQDFGFPDGELPVLSTGVHHDARDDAINQALMVQACYAARGLSRDPVQFHKD